MRAETLNTVEAIKKSLKLLAQRMDWETAPHRLEEFNAMIEDGDLWSDPARAQKLMRERQMLMDKVETYRKIERELTDNVELIELGVKAEDALKLKVHAATAALPYVHQKQPMAVEAVGKTAGLLVLPGEGGTAVEQAAEMGFDLEILPNEKAVAYQQLSDEAFGKSDEPQSEGEGK